MSPRPWPDSPPSCSYGASGEHQAFPGICSIGTTGLLMVIVELVCSITTWAGGVVLVNGHGGNLRMGAFRGRAWKALLPDVRTRDRRASGVSPHRSPRKPPGNSRLRVQAICANVADACHVNP